MAITSKQFLLGASVGIGAAAAGYIVYKKNQEKIDSFLRDQGFNVPVAQSGTFDDMTMEELALSKERLEDLIAEREAAENETKKAEAKPKAKKA